MAKITDYTEKLRSQVERMNAHPYKETSEDVRSGLRYFKEPLCSWDDLEELKDKNIDSDEAYDAINGNKEIKTSRIMPQVERPLWIWGEIINLVRALIICFPPFFHYLPIISLRAC